MLIKEKSERNTLEMVSLEELAPQDYLLRKIDCAVDFTHIYDFMEDLYCENSGNPSVDPVVLFKMVLIQCLYGILLLGRAAKRSTQYDLIKISRNILASLKRHFLFWLKVE